MNWESFRVLCLWCCRQLIRNYVPFGLLLGFLVNSELISLSLFWQLNSFHITLLIPDEIVVNVQFYLERYNQQHVGCGLRARDYNIQIE